MERREFLKAGVAALAGACWSERVTAEQAKPAAKGRFALKYAPHFGMFKHSAGNDLLDQLKFAADQGFAAWQDSGLSARPVEVQEKIGRTLASLDMEMGAFQVAAGFQEVSFAWNDDPAWQGVLHDIRRSVEVAKRVNARWLSVVPGRYYDGGDPDGQAANCVELLKRCCDILEPHGLVLVLEPLNWGTNGSVAFPPKPALRLESICRAVGSPSCKILFDIGRLHGPQGGLVPKIDWVWSEIGYFHSADNPGRKEPGTGSIDYRSVFRHLAARGYSGIVGMEHGNSKPGADGERAVIEAYVAAECV
jgi:hydroxypyruvate isomerase